jgi:hypothetical protein
MPVVLHDMIKDVAPSSTLALCQCHLSLLSPRPIDVDIGPLSIIDVTLQILLMYRDRLELLLTSVRP